MTLLERHNSTFNDYPMRGGFTLSRAVNNYESESAT